MSTINTEPPANTVTASASQAKATHPTSVYVYEAPLRIWHWTNAAAITTLAITGYFIASPPPTMPGEASDNFLLGYIRFTHFTAAYILAIGFVFRLYWAFAGNEYAKGLFLPPFWRRAWRTEIREEIRWYLFLQSRPKKYIGYAPLAQLATFFFITLGTVFMIVTGFAMYGEGAQPGSWANTLFGWVIPLVGQSQNLHTLHHLGMWFLVVFIIVHIYVAIREDIMSRQSIVSTMISGYRTFKDDDPN